MSYYTLPKNNNTIQITPTYNEDVCSVYTSSSLLNYYNDIKNQYINIFTLDKESYKNFNEVIKIINPYEYVYSKVPGSKFSVSKLKYTTSVFYDFFEIATIMNIFDSFKEKNINILNVGFRNNNITECIEMMRENYTDNILAFDEINNNEFEIIQKYNFDFLFFDNIDSNNIYDINSYCIDLIKNIMVILKNQNKQGISLIKITHIFYKPVVDIIYILTCLFEKVYIIKSTTSNVINFDKYLVCKNFQINDVKRELYDINYLKLYEVLLNLNLNLNARRNVVSLINYDIPYYFINKIDELNNIIGQQQLENMSQIINILNNKNKDEKIESLKKLNIQKSVTWCEKFKIPYNKFIEKTNIFLPNVNDDFESKPICDIEIVFENYVG